MAFEIVLHENREEEPRSTALMMSKMEGRKLETDSKLFFALEIKWNFALLARNLHGTGPRMNLLNY